MSFLSKIFGDANDRYIKELMPIVQKINSLEKECEQFSDSQMKEKTDEFKKRLTAGETLDDILPEAFALVREASKRTLNQRHYDVQLMGGIILHRGAIAEMRTGEGKTLVATLPSYLNALTGKGVHIVTVNDYLARRDATWMGQIYNALDLTVGCINHDSSFVYDAEHKNQDTERDEVGGFKVIHEFMRPVTRKEAYIADITYGTNNEYGFDYLRDNMAYSVDQMAQRPYHNYAIVDEVDSILIDEARTPLIISAPDQDSGDLYKTFSRVVPNLIEDEDYNVDEKLKAVSITEKGIEKVEKTLNIKNIYDEGGMRFVHHLEQALKANVLFKLDRDYVVKDGEVVIVDEFTGRLMPGRRWSEGLHQAVEAKEGVSVQKESRTLATITFQNYFRLYGKLSGMTGTARTSAEEFHKVYNLDVITAPTNKTMIRKDQQDQIYKTEAGKFRNVAKEIKERHAKGQPVLVGTVSIERNEMLSAILEREGIPHKVLNAKNHEKEAEIIAQAGQVGAVTVATNMAGRGVDIILGGNPPDIEEQQKAREVGGLHVIGTERHESRRIDNQLRGRSGRQGDPGSTRFYLALDDEIMRIFGGDQVAKIMGFLKIPENEPIEHGMVSKAIEQAQIKVEGFNFDARKHVVDYDDVMNKQREIIYGLRSRVLKNEITDEEVITKLQNQLAKIVNIYAPRGIVESEVLPIVTSLVEIVPFDDFSQQALAKQMKTSGTAGEIIKLTGQIIGDAASKRKKQVGDKTWEDIIKYAYLTSIDTLWMDHLDAVDDLRSGIGLRGYGQRDPLVEYKGEAFAMFERLVTQIDSEFGKRLFRIQIGTPPPIQPPPQMIEIKPEMSVADLAQPEVATPVSSAKNAPPREFLSAFSTLQKGGQENPRKNLGRNDPCWCGKRKPDGSPVKYKHCHYPN